MSAEVIPVSEKQVVLFKFKNKSVDFSMRSGYYEYIRASLSARAVYQKENARWPFALWGFALTKLPGYQAAG